MGFKLAFEKEKVKKCYLFEGFWILWKWQACFSYLSISSDWPDQITWDLKFKLFVFFPTLDSNRKPICNANLEIFWKNIILPFFKYICILVLHFFLGKKSRYQKIMLCQMLVSKAILVRPVVRKSARNTIQLCSLWWGGTWNAIRLRGKTQFDCRNIIELCEGTQLDCARIWNSQQNVIELRST